MSKEELLKIATQIRELGKRKHDVRGAREMGGALLVEAIKLGAFAGSEYALLLHCVDLARQGPKGSCERAFIHAIDWFIEQDERPLPHGPHIKATFQGGWDTRIVNPPAEWRVANFHAIAEMVEEEAQAIQTAAEPDDDASYRPKSEARSMFGFTSEREFSSFLKRHKIRTQKPIAKSTGKPHPRRLNVHIGDVAEAKARESDPLDQPGSVVDAIAEAARRKDQIDQKRRK